MIIPTTIANTKKSTVWISTELMLDEGSLKPITTVRTRMPMTSSMMAADMIV